MHCRVLRKAQVFAVTTVLTLALGIGATTSIFTLVHAVLLKSLAVSSPDDLYRLGRETHCCMWGGYRQNNEFSIFSYDLYKYFRDNTKGFAELAAFQAGATGLPLTIAAGRFLSNQLYGMNPYDPLVTSLAVVALGFSALVASLIPAFRASSISPLQALRIEGF